MPLILGTNSIKDTGYNVANSVRFNRGDSPKMSKTLGTPSDADKFTFSAWVKLTDFGTDRFILSLYTDDNNETAINFENGNSINFYNYISGSYAGRLVPSQKLRDPSSWYHLVAVFDSGNATAGNRMRLYLNGSEITSFATDSNPSQDQDSKNASGVTCVVGRSGTDDYNFGGYMAEVVFIDGSALTPTSFGEFDEDSPTIWKPKDVSGLTFGNNGFYLDFEDSSNLGNDVNGGTDLTEANLAATDQSIDTCTNNFAVMNPLDNYYANSTFSEGNLKIATVSGNAAYNPATFGLTTGKWYFEVKPTSCGDAQERNIIGISNQSPVAAGYDGSIVIGDGFGLRGNGKMWDGSSETSGWNSFDAGDIVSVAVDFDNGKFYTATNGTYGNSSNPSTGSNGYSFTVGTKPWFPGVNCRETSQTATFELDFGSAPYAISSGNADANGYGNFEYAVPSGFYSINSKNLAEFG